MSLNNENQMTAIVKMLPSQKDELRFLLKDVPISVANGIRRTILSDIPIVVIRTEKSKINLCSIKTNTTRFHNEIVKQRLSSIPIFTKEFATFVEKYRLILDVKNETNELRWVTTDDFRILDKANEQFLDDSEVRKFFPHGIKDRPIDFLRLRPAVSATIPGEHIQLTADFSISNAKENGMFNVVSKCSYHNVIDPAKKEKSWAEQLQKLKDDQRDEKEIVFEKTNFEYLDAYRSFKTNEQGDANEFDFTVKSIGQYTNKEIVFNACDILVQRFESFVAKMEQVPIFPSDKTREMGYTSVPLCPLENSCDVILENEDYTMGYLLEHYIHELFYNKDDFGLVFIGFKKYHPHDDFSIVRLAFSSIYKSKLIETVKHHLIEACLQIIRIIGSIRKTFASKN